MMIARRFVSGAVLTAIACVGFAGCAEDNDKNMMNTAGAPAAGVPPVPPSNDPPAPSGNDPEARKKYEMERQAKQYSSYPGYNSKGR